MAADAVNQAAHLASQIAKSGIISQALTASGSPVLGALVKLAGGKRKSKRRHSVKGGMKKSHRKKMRGGSWLGDIAGAVLKPVAGGIIGATQGAYGGFAGLGKRRKLRGRGVLLMPRAVIAK